MIDHAPILLLAMLHDATSSGDRNEALLGSPTGQSGMACADGPHAAFAIGSGRAAPLPARHVPFSAIEDPTPAAYATSPSICRQTPKLACTLTRRARARRHGRRSQPIRCCRWSRIASKVRRMPSARCQLRRARHRSHARPDAGDQPRPLRPRTPLLGSYLGIREGGRLVAMAGERMRVPGYVELSAISTHPQARRAAMQGTSPPS